MKRFLPLALLALAAGCATYYGGKLDERYGEADATRYDRSVAVPGGPDFQTEVKPILDGRCVVCHGCYDAPCQLSLGSYEGVVRGAKRESVYSTRLTAAEPTRLFLDTQRNSGPGGWRARGFTPVLNERIVTLQANLEGSVLYRSLRLKHAHPMNDGAPLPKDVDTSLDRAQQCPAVEQMDAFERKYPAWGMPFGLPALDAREQDVLTRWIAGGAPYVPPAPLSAAHAERVAQWENFLNGDSLKMRLAARYVYEHWFVGHLYFDDVPGGEFFQLVRSKTPPGQPVDLIATRRPYDDPGVARVYYRLVRSTETALAKTRMPYALNPARMARLKAWFVDTAHEVRALPSYEPALASNPFATFVDLPVGSRYRFMLDEAQFTLQGFIKGPVCRGQVALNVINDHFWVLFVSPEEMEGAEDAAFLARERDNLRLPAEHESTASMLHWVRYANREAQYLAAKSKYLQQRVAGRPPTLAGLWNGEGRNPNAGLTVFRHYDSATVLQGLAGEQPQTVMLMGYPLFERIHYLLVAGFDVYGSAGHQLSTRLYMDFLRMEGELNFLGLLPRAARQPVRDRWNRGAPQQSIQHLQDADAYYTGETGIQYRDGDALAELYRLVKARLAPVAPAQPAVPADLRALSAVKGRAASYLPEASILTVRAADGDRHYTLLLNRAHSNVSSLAGEARRLLPEEDTVSLLPGFAAAYPNAFLVVEAKELPALTEAVRTLGSPADAQALLRRYGVRRTDSRFWAHSDALHAAYRRVSPREAGQLDYNRYENW
jgi:hypothetical protein